MAMACPGTEFHLTSDLEVGIAFLAAVVQALPDLHVSVIGILAIHHPAGAMIMRAGAAGFLTSVHQDIDIGLGIVMDAMGAEGGRIAEMVAQQIGIPQQLFQVLADLLNAFRSWFTFKAVAGVSDELLQAIGFFQRLSLCISCIPSSLTACSLPSAPFLPPQAL